MKKLALALVVVALMGGVAFAGDNDESPEGGDTVVCPDGYVVVEGLNACKQLEGSGCPSGWTETYLGLCICEGDENTDEGGCVDYMDPVGNPIDCPAGWTDYNHQCVPYCAVYDNDVCDGEEWWGTPHDAPTGSGWYEYDKIVFVRADALYIVDPKYFTIVRRAADWGICSPGYFDLDDKCVSACLALDEVPCPSETVPYVINLAEF